MPEKASYKKKRKNTKLLHQKIQSVVNPCKPPTKTKSDLCEHKLHNQSNFLSPPISDNAEQILVCRIK